MELSRIRHIITVNANITIDQTVIDPSVYIYINGQTVTLADGPGTDLVMNGDVSFQSGTFNANGSILVNSSATFNIWGGGTLNVTNGAGTDLDVNGTLLLSSGTIAGNGQTSVNTGGTFTWSGGTLSGLVSTTVNAGSIFTMNGTNNHYLEGTHTLNNYTTCNWSGTGHLNYGAGPATFNNYGTFNINTDADIASYNFSPANFNNLATGIINKSGSADTYFGSTMTFNNAGAFNINSGFINIDGAGNFSGPVFIASGSGLGFGQGGTSSFNAGTVFSGAGYVSLFQASTTINLNSSITFPTNNFYFSAGNLNGNGSMTFNSGSTFEWSGGNINGGTFNLNAGSIFTISQGTTEKFYNGGTI